MLPMVRRSLAVQVVSIQSSLMQFTHAIDPKPLRAMLSKAEATEGAWCLLFLDDLASDGLENTENAVELWGMIRAKLHKKSFLLLTPFFFMYMTNVRPLSVPTLKN